MTGSTAGQTDVRRSGGWTILADAETVKRTIEALGHRGIAAEVVPDGDAALARLVALGVAFLLFAAWRFQRTVA